MLLPIATFFVIYIVSYYYTLYPNEINVYIAFSSIVSLVIANVALIFLFEWQLKQTKNLNKEILEKQQLKNQTDYYEELLENKKEYNKFVHDLKNRMFAIRDEVSNNNATGLEKLNAMCDFIEEKQQIFYTQNTAINALINSKQQKMKNHDIEFSCKATILEHNNIDDMTLCVLIGNIMDNAIEACIKLSSKRYMILDMIQQEDYLSIQLNNSCDDSIINKNLTTVKADKSMHGFGLSTIRDICSTNNGTIEILHNDGQFEVIILLKNKIQYPKL